MSLEWIKTAEGREVLVNTAAIEPPPAHPARSDVIEAPRTFIGSSRGNAPIREHISSVLPRWTPYHKGDFVKHGRERGKPIVRTQSERDHIEKASGGRFVFNHRTERAGPGLDTQ